MKMVWNELKMLFGNEKTHRLWSCSAFIPELMRKSRIQLETPHLKLKLDKILQHPQSAGQNRTNAD